MRLLRPALVAGALAAVGAAGCNDVPLVPKWDADWYVPMASQTIQLPNGTIPGGVSVSDSFPTQAQDMGDAAGQVLSRDLRSASVIFTLDKNVDVSVADTLFIAASAADLGNPNATRIVLPVTMNASATTTSDTVAVIQSGLTMLANVAEAAGTLFIQMRGTVSNPGPGSVTIDNSNNTIDVRLALLARIGVSTRGN